MSAPNPLKVLVTGAGGLLGRGLARLLAHECDLVPLGREDLDLTDDNAVWAKVRETRPDVVLNAAAYTDADAAEDDPLAALAVNAGGVRSLARAAFESDATLVHYSTDFVFSGSASEPYGEDHRADPLSVYGMSKLLGEWFAQGARHYVLRLGSLFGGPPVEAGAQVRRTGRTGGTIDLLADALLDGREVRALVDRVVSPSYVDDVARATSLIVRGSPPRGLYHCVQSGHANWFEIVMALASELGVDATIGRILNDDLKLRAERPLFSALSNRKLARAGVEMPHWRDALKRYARTRRQRKGGAKT